LRSLNLENLQIEQHFLKYVVISGGTVGVHFAIVAPEQDGKRLETELRKLEKEHALKYFAREDGPLGTMTSGPGLCDLVNLKIERDTSSVRVLYRIYYEKHTTVSGEDRLTKLLEKLHYAISEQQLDTDVGNQVYATKARLEKKYQYGDKGIDYQDEEQLKSDARVWIELLAKSLSARPAFEPTKPILLNAESLMQAATDYSNPFFDDAIWRSLAEVARNDFKETTRCFMAAAWTAAAMVALRGAEAVLRQYYEFRTQAKSSRKQWSEIVEELEGAHADRTLLGYLDFIRERRNETQHPEKTYNQRESENIFTVVINAVTAMCVEISSSQK